MQPSPTSRLDHTLLGQNSEYNRPMYCLPWGNTLYSNSCPGAVQSRWVGLSKGKGNILVER
jgi:hypothetical protein